MATGIFQIPFLLQIHQGVLDAIRVGDLAEDETLFFRGGLDEDIAIIQHRRNDAGNFGGNVLDARQFQFAHLAVEKPLLFDIDHALIGNNPDIEIIIDPDEKKSYPDEHAKKIS